MQQWTGTWSAGAGGRALQSASFLNDAFQQLDEVLKRKAEAQAQQPPPPPTQELKASQQMIQRWLVIFARDHPADICEKLMAAAKEHSATAVPARSLPKQQLPTKSDEHDSRSELRGDGSIDYFLLDSLRRVLAAAAADESGAALRAVCEQLRSAEKGGGDHSGRDPAQPGLLDFCYSRISVVYSAPIRHVASECVGLLSAARLKPVVEMFLASLARVTSDRDEREFVPSMRATRLLQLSTHSAEQAAASLAYLKALASSMARVSRGVLRAEVCAALVEALPRLMAPADDDRSAYGDAHLWPTCGARGWVAYLTRPVGTEGRSRMRNLANEEEAVEALREALDELGYSLRVVSSPRHAVWFATAAGLVGVHGGAREQQKPHQLGVPLLTCDAQPAGEIGIVQHTLLELL